MSGGLSDYFENADAVLAAINADRPSDSGNDSRENTAREGWDLGLGYQGAEDAYCGGWADGAQRAYDLAATLAPRPVASRTALHRSVAGAFPNVGAFLAGAPDAMYQVSKKTAHGRPFVRLAVNFAYNASVTATAAFERGCAIVALVDALETAGCRLQILGIDAVTYSTTARYVGTYKFKDYADRLTVDSVMFTLAHPAFFRRLMFAIYERSRHAAVRKATLGGYGHAVTFTAADLVDDDRAVTVCVPRLDHAANRKQAAEFLAEIVATLPAEIQTTITDPS